ncbi:protein TRM32-like [Impatiens glandulifera]|uniref:protein TRM32-like n=1 Tax=Impatiens glandulifera TaxID=253017 RepID=UPI001FB083AE|nr:protein TRM32-like [Impatiens glandulifera]
MHGTTFPKKPSLLARIKSFITHEEKKRKEDSNSTQDLETLDHHRTSVGWKHRISLLLSLATKNGIGFQRKNTKYSSQIQCLISKKILEDQKNILETTQPFNSLCQTSMNMMPRSLQDKIDEVTVFFQKGKQCNFNYVKPAANIRRTRTSSSLDESLQSYSRFMSLSFSGDEDDRCSSKTLKVSKGLSHIQMKYLKRFPSLTHDEFGNVYCESMNGISETVENEDMKIGLLSSSETYYTKKNEFSSSEIIVHEMFKEKETELISDDQILSLEDRVKCTSMSFPSTGGFHNREEEESPIFESNMLMQDQDHLSCSSESMGNSNLKYVTEILQLSGILGNECFNAWHSIEQPLDPEMFEDIESCSKSKELSECSSNNIIDHDENMPCYTHQHKLLFDLTNEVLVQIYDRTCTYCPRVLSSKCNGWCKPFPVGKHLLKVVLANISRSLIMNLTDQKMMEIKMDQDLIKDDLWMNLHVFSENVALELEAFIFDRVMDEELQILEVKGTDLKKTVYSDVV